MSLSYAPDNGPAPTPTTAVAPAADTPWWEQLAQDALDQAATHWQAAAALLLLTLLTWKIAARLRRAPRTPDGADDERGELTRADRAITRLTAGIATAVLATGMWKFFGDVLDFHWTIRLVLFAFAEAQIISAFRRTRRHIYRHGTLGHGGRVIYAIAAGSALLASIHATSTDEAAFRWFVAIVAAYMVVEELAEELDIWLTAHPQKRPVGARKPGTIHWALTPERVLVWLRLAEPTSRDIEDVAKARRLARLARTAYRLHLLTETGARRWRVRLAARSLRRQTESANEHLSLGTDRAAIRVVREHLALLYQVEDATTRASVADVSPWMSGARLAIADRPHRTPAADMTGQASGVEVDIRPDTVPVTRPDSAPDTRPVSTVDTVADSRPDMSTDASPGMAVDIVTGQVPDISPDAALDIRPAAQPDTRPVTTTVADRTPEADIRPRRDRTSTRTPRPDTKSTAAQVKARKLRDEDGLTYEQIARRLNVSTKTIQRWLSKTDEQDTAVVDTPDTTVPMSPIPEPRPAVTAGTNGHAYPTTKTEEN